jgi:Mor family transcriptional regulator
VSQVDTTDAQASAQPIQPPDSYPEILGELLVTLQSELHAAGLDVTSANDIAWRTAEKIRDAWGGQTVYVPQGTAFEARQRYEEIWQAFDGKNVHSLARRHNISEQAVYAALRFMRDEMQRRQQPQLPLEE